MDKKKKGIIIGASVAAGVLIIALIIAFATGLFGGKEVEVPPFKNMTLQEAQDAAAELDLTIKEGDQVVSEEVEAGLIVSQDPEAGTKVKSGSTITVNISKGLGDGSVPNLIGAMENEASAKLEAAGFELGDTDEKASDEPKGTIIGQTPEAGTEAAKGSEVDIVVSDGSKAKAVVPYLVGKSIGDAQAALLNAGLEPGDLSYDYSNTYSEGEVMWQQYDANAQLEKGTSVKMRVSKGPKPEATQPPQDSGDSGEDQGE